MTHKWQVICFLGALSIAFAESSLTSDKMKLVKALKEKFKQLKFKKESRTPLVTPKGLPQRNDKSEWQEMKNILNLHQHDKAASAIGLALLDVSKPRHLRVEHLTNKAKDIKKIKEAGDVSEDDEEEEDDEDKASNTVRSSKEKKDRNMTDKQSTDNKAKGARLVTDKFDNKIEQEDDDEEDLEDDERDNSKDDTSDKKKEKGKIKNSDKKLKKSNKSLKNSTKSLKDKDLQTVNVGELKKLLAASVENLDKAGKAIQDLLQYDLSKKSSSKNSQAQSPPTPDYPQTYGGYSQGPLSPYQTTCPGQCSSLCAPGCRDPCCRFPPIAYNSAPVQARGSYQQGLINSYPPMTALGPEQSSQNYQQSQLGQQCGSQCSPQSCSSSCNPSCCSSAAQGVSAMPQGQINAGCPASCFSNCDMSCPRRCCVPGRK